jgi:hypothetical protein
MADAGKPPNPRAPSARPKPAPLQTDSGTIAVPSRSSSPTLVAAEGEAGQQPSVPLLTPPGGTALAGKRSQPPRPAPQTGRRPITANRQPLGEGVPTKSEVHRRLQAEAANTALNVFAILRDLWSDFRSSDRFFKYKALIVASWVVLSGTGFVVACPGSPSRHTDFGAKLIVSEPGGRRIYLIKNEGNIAWQNVRVIVNGEFQVATPKIDPGNDLVFGAKQLMGNNGRLAPEGMTVTTLELRTSEGDAVMIKEGQVLQ